ncbi:Ppx/GppA phosphatase family protein [Rickettsia typhi]|uniref:Guanosine pentaphosphate phosphohydrolase n=2 Tax=Rickettsia typhi TaxID=785 RepID=Q68X77_RICTY|nr:Ppx/GppA phosphatase family protein [Rickettsia typhi]AAU03765.1 Guanosine pentaphosphate phosphohydrolase [Rickettsia typhi str. Wilmington]AFE54142.1 guanosine pentaphosphate phosphohydrolase [Rickettsia typhi str. TH1527]AFE54981.1 guanosine pentaphosphate phosphohydrolase [Rickettsia typhi str. B9991CWPP]
MRSAIIDIGSNALRAVVYESDELGAPEIFNYKFRNYLTNLLNLDNLDVKHQTYLSIQYLIHVFTKLSVTNIKCVATAILRGHPKADEFKTIIKKRFNIDIEIISGEREAYLTAAGLISGISDAFGIVADLGGGSLELAHICNKKVGKLKSLPLGTKIITNSNVGDVGLITKMLEEEFGVAHYPNLYLIGGALRLMSRIYMESINYPLKNLHNFEINRVEFELYLEKLSQIDKLKLSYYEQKAINYNAVLVIKAMLKVFSPEKIIISNYGLKEGVRFDSLPYHETEKDIIYERVKRLVNFDKNICKIEKYIEALQYLLINSDATTLIIIELAIMLAQYNKNIDKTLRANFVSEFILSSDIPFSQRQRLMLGIALTVTYTAKTDMQINKIAKKMISKSDYYNSHIIGYYIKIAREIDGPEFQEPSFSIKLKDDKFLQINASNILPKQVFDKVCERLKDISSARKNISYNFSD